MGMSEPGAGTDVLGMKTKAMLDGDSYVLTGQKMWITNGTLDGKSTGDLFLVYGRTGEGRSDVSSFIVEKAMPGFSMGQQIKEKLGMRASPTSEIVFDNVRVPRSQLVGDENHATLCMMRNLEIERLGLAAMGLGIARRAINVMKDYANQRNAFGKNLFAFGQIQSMIASSYAEYMVR